MKLSEAEVESRLRRTFAAMAEAPLDDPVVAEATARRRSPFATAAAVAAAAAVVLGAVVLVDGGEPPVTPASQGEGGGDVTDGPWLGEAESALLFRAEQRLMHDCMKAAGQPYVEVPPSSGDLDAGWNRLGRTDPERAGRIGYGTPTGGKAKGANPVQADLKTAVERDAWSMALTGEPYATNGGPTGPSVPIVNPVTGEQNGGQSAGGCFGQAQRELYGDQSRHTSLSHWLVNDVRGEIEDRVVADPRFKQAIARWSTCMKEHGHDYDDPFGPVNEFNVEGGAGRPSATELAVARADVDCKEQVGLVRAYDELKAAHGRVVLAPYERYVAEYRQIVDRALAKAEALLGARP